MLTNNFYNLLLGQVFGRATTYKDVYFGDERSASHPWSSDYISKYTQFSGMSVADQFLFGDGTTPPTPNDYKMESGLSETNLAISVQYQTTTDGNINKHVANITITNNNATDITITEIGHFTSKVYKSNGNSGSSAYALLDRTLLDKPLIIPAEGIGKIKYTIEVDLTDVFNKIV